MTLKISGKGNIKAQQRRRRERMKEKPKRLKTSVQLIDGNWSFYAVAFCACHGGYLTQGLIDTHRCKKRHCSGFRKVVVDEKD